MFESYRQTFYPPHKNFANKSILSANKFVSLQIVNALYVRVETSAKQYFMSAFMSILTSDAHDTSNECDFISLCLIGLEFYC